MLKALRIDPVVKLVGSVFGFNYETLKQQNRFAIELRIQSRTDYIRLTDRLECLVIISRVSRAPAG